MSRASDRIWGRFGDCKRVSPSFVTRVLSYRVDMRELSSSLSPVDEYPEWNPRIVDFALTYFSATDTASHSVDLPHDAGPMIFTHNWSPIALVLVIDASMTDKARS